KFSYLQYTKCGICLAISHTSRGEASAPASEMNLGKARLLGALSLSLTLAPACGATPLPQPPSTVDPDAMTLTQATPGVVQLKGAAGAISPGDVAIRITLVLPLPAALSPPPTATLVGKDGSFSASFAGARTDLFYIERLDPDHDVFIGVV